MKTVLQFFRHRILACLATQLALPLLANPSVAAAAAESAPTPMFRALDFPGALEAAKREQRFVLVDFYTTWCGPCRLLDDTTWQDAKVMARVSATAVAIKVDAEKERAIAKRFQIDAYPTLVVLAADGTERDRYIGYVAPKAFLEKYEATLSGRSVVADAKVKLDEKGGKDPKVRLELARGLAKQPGQEGEALKQFLVCYDELAAKNPRIALMISELGKRHPPALEALRERRDSLWQRLGAAGARVSPEQCAQLGFLDAALRDEALITQGLAAFAPGSRAQKAYGDPLLPRLVQLKRYADALAVSDLDADFAKVSQMIAQAEASGRGSPAQIAQLKHSAAKEGGMPLEVLAGAGELDRARRLARQLLAWDDSADVRAALAKRLERAGATELAAEMATLRK